MESTTLKEAFEEIRRLSQNPATRNIADSREKFLLDQIQFEEDARNEGMEKGIEETKEEIVMNLYMEDFPIEDIVRLTRLPIEKVKAIIESISQ